MSAQQSWGKSRQDCDPGLKKLVRYPKHAYIDGGALFGMQLSLSLPPKLNGEGERDKDNHLSLDVPKGQVGNLIVSTGAEYDTLQHETYNAQKCMEDFVRLLWSRIKGTTNSHGVYI
jgi:hypothetical protein